MDTIYETLSSLFWGRFEILSWQSSFMNNFVRLSFNHLYCASILLISSCCVEISCNAACIFDNIFSPFATALCTQKKILWAKDQEGRRRDEKNEFRIWKQRERERVREKMNESDFLRTISEEVDLATPAYPWLSNFCIFHNPRPMPRSIFFTQTRYIKLDKTSWAWT